ncbi:MAG: winged helix-turn-helix transcriptional regulator [bacterium]|nr:winged helix-turn-helix transcriptional regulator [bacterium]
MSDRRVLDVVFVLRRETRQHLLIGLAEGPLTARMISDRLNVPISTVRANLRTLEHHGLVVRETEKARNAYRLGPEVRVSKRARTATITFDAPPSGRMDLRVPYPPPPRRTKR